ncbi:ZIP family metal transporter [Gloeobacter kilaueensis]|uniref:ZIP family metal transporter n=1 Tax=Gloeobacter kilaueensis TaxID=1416614 RepID=UPI0030842A50
MILSLLALAATLIGGAVVLRFRQLPPELLAFSAGTLLTILGLDLLPYSLQVCGPLALLACGLSYGGLWWWQRSGRIGGHSHGPEALESHPSTESALVGAVALIVHKLLDGAILGIGLSTGSAIAAGIGLAVVLHSFCDGINTVVLVLRARADRHLAALFLVTNAVAPLVAALGIGGLHFAPAVLGWLISAVSGTFLFIVLHDLLPAALQSQSDFSIAADGKVVLFSSRAVSLAAGLSAGVLLTWALNGLLSQ